MRYINLPKSVFVIGSGPIIIGQACEFDYSGTQACKALREEGCRVILLNSNPATIMTDPDLADATYIEPITIENIIEILKLEQPEALLPTLGGQIALNLALELHNKGILQNHNVKLIGATHTTIEKAENRELFRQAMQRIGLETPLSFKVHNIKEALQVQSHIGFPIIVRSSYTLGGAGCAIIRSKPDFLKICSEYLDTSLEKAIQLEESLLGWKEFEMEAIRDQADNCIIVCCIENIDPMGIHTGDSITVAPAQTLSNKEYQRMRQATFAVLREIGVNTGGANIQFAIHPKTGRMVVIEMNPRVSRSSALASKATGYPIAKIAAKLALGYRLDELSNEITGNQIPASFEPTVDYVVIKIPRFNFDKFPESIPNLDMKMRSVGEVIGIGRNFQESLNKAISSLDNNIYGLKSYFSANGDLELPSYDRLFRIAEALRNGISINEIYDKSSIDPWFLAQIYDLVCFEQKLKDLKLDKNSIGIFFYAKRKGFTDRFISELIGLDESEFRYYRKKYNIKPVYKRIDSCAAEFSPDTAYMYSTYESKCEAKPSSKQKILIIGSGPNRIGQGIEFDYNCVHAATACRDCGYETIMVNCNPETVSTDFDIADRLYLEPLTYEHLLNIYEMEKPNGALIQFGGQTALNLAKQFNHNEINILGTKLDAINQTENREEFYKLCKDLGLNRAKCIILASVDSDYNSEEISFPAIVRPSNIISGSAIRIIYTKEDLDTYLGNLPQQNNIFPILIEEYLTNAIEVELDGISDGKTVFIAGIMEQFEPVGIHSGDSISCFPPHSLSKKTQAKLKNIAELLVTRINIIGFYNIQFGIKGDIIYIIELNPRASRTIPFLSKALDLPLAQIATKVILGISLADQNILKKVKYPTYFSVKKPIFSNYRYTNEEIQLGPEMLSTGEVMLIGETPEQALNKISGRCILPKSLQSTSRNQHANSCT